MNYYNEHDPKAAAWLRELIKGGHIAHGIVDERSITDILPGELEGYTQCHFFAGIGGWSLALRLAGWPDDKAVWTGSCPCQPFSGAGLQLGFSDPRHLWPEWFRLIQKRRPPVIFGEQVSKATQWLDQVYIDLEAEDYAVAAADIPAASVGAPHFRYRLYFVAHAGCQGLEGVHKEGGGKYLQSTPPAISWHDWKADPAVLRAVNGLSTRLDRPPDYKDRIRTLGNAIVPQVAAEFIAAYLEATAMNG